MISGYLHALRWLLAWSILLSSGDLIWAAERLPVKAIPLEKQEAGSIITAFGILEKDPQILYFETSGYLEELLVEEGDQVEKGQVLARLDATIINNRKAQLQISIKHAANKLERTQKLKNSKVLAQDELEDTEFTYETRLLEWKEVAKELQKHILYAPADGKIQRRFLDFSGPIDPTTPVFIIKPDNRPWLLTASLTEREVSAVKIGDSASIHFDGLPDNALSGEIRKIADHSEQHDGMVEVDIALNEAAPFLRVGMNAKVRIETSTNQMGYLLPLNAVFQITGNKAMVFVIDKDGAAQKRQIEFELTASGSAVLVLSNLSQFDQVIVLGQHNLKDGTLVQITQE